MKHIAFSKQVALTALAAAVFMVVGGCSPKAPSADASPDEEAIALSWSADSECALCHVAQASSFEDSSCIAALHANQQCASCHNDTDALTTVHADATTVEEATVKRLKKTSVDEALCLSCHVSLEDLATKTADCTSLTDDNGLVVNPHALPDNAEHGDISCGSCHTMHAGSDANEEAEALCTSCHHEGVYECFTCHA